MGVPSCRTEAKRIAPERYVGLARGVRPTVSVRTAS
jgi:hypothetical protein